mmetsp:Transcript_57827/g.65993  ORF Transcript_57827/g.65993 Transcript_57827/m.65993 type:complete len:761 (-) Transcript_57827:363-2645(-)
MDQLLPSLHRKMQKVRDSICRPDWCPFMRTTYAEMKEQRVRKNILTWLVMSCIFRVLMFFIMYESAYVHPYVLLAGVPVLFVGHYLLKRGFHTNIITLLAAPIDIISAFLSLGWGIDSNSEGAFLIIFQLIILLACATVMRQFSHEIALQIGYQVFLWSLVGSMGEITHTPYIWGLYTLTGLAIGIFLSIQRAAGEMNLAEERFKNKDLHFIASQLPSGVAVRRPGKVMFMNSSFEGLLKEFMGENNRQQIGEEGEVLGLLSEFESNINQNRRQLPLNGSMILEREGCSIEVSYSQITWFDHSAELITLLDVTAMQNIIKELEDADKFRTNLIRTVTHDFRTPLNVITNGLEMLLREGNLPQSMHSFIKLSHQASQFLLYLVSNLLDYSQLKMESFRIVGDPCDVYHIVALTTDLLESKATAAQVRLEVTIAAEVREISRNWVTDPMRLQQVLINLITNAIKYSRRRSKVSINVRLFQDELFIDVKDTGLGIKPENLDRLFHEFGRVVDEENMQYNPKGIGLGLWVCQQICDKLGSGIRVASEYRKGSSFTFSLKKLQVCASKTKTLTNIGTEDSLDAFRSLRGSLLESKTPINQNFKQYVYSCHPSKIDVQNDLESTNTSDPRDINPCFSGILIIDDDLFNQMVLREILTPMGLRSEFVSAPLECLETLEIRRTLPDAAWFGLLIVDYDMPEMLGPELIRRIRVLETRHSLPASTILGHTGYGEEEQRALLNAGANDILVKPVNVSQLHFFLRKYSLTC